MPKVEEGRPTPGARAEGGDGGRAGGRLGFALENARQALQSPASRMARWGPTSWHGARPVLKMFFAAQVLSAVLDAKAKM